MRTRAILETDRVWSAYALADLDPAESDRLHLACRTAGRRPRLSGPDTPGPLRCTATRPRCPPCFGGVPEGEYIFTLLQPDRAALSSPAAGSRRASDLAHGPPSRPTSGLRGIHGQPAQPRTICRTC